MDLFFIFYLVCLFFIILKISKFIDSGLVFIFYFFILFFIVFLRISFNTRSLLISRCEGYFYFIVVVFRYGLEVKFWGRGQVQFGGVRFVYVGFSVFFEEEAFGVIEVGGEFDFYRGRFFGFCFIVNVYRSCLIYNIKKVEVL